MKRKTLVPALAAAWAALGAPIALAQVSQKISQMPNAAALGGSELMAAVQSGSNVSITPAQIKAYVAAQPALSPGYVAGNWYAPPFVSAVAGAALRSDTISCTLQLSLAPMTVQAMGARITSAGTSNVQLADYANLNGRPAGAPLGYTADISNASTGVVSAPPVGGTFALPAGPYWACVNAGDSTVVMQASSNTVPGAAAFIGSATEANVSASGTNLGVHLTLAQTFGTWPAATAAGWAEVGNNYASAILLHQSN